MERCKDGDSTRIFLETVYTHNNEKRKGWVGGGGIEGEKQRVGKREG